MVKKKKDFIDNKRKTKKLLPSLQRKNTKKTVRLLLISSRKELKKWIMLTLKIKHYGRCGKRKKKKTWKTIIVKEKTCKKNLQILKIYENVSSALKTYIFFLNLKTDKFWNSKKTLSFLKIWENQARSKFSACFFIFHIFKFSSLFSHQNANFYFTDCGVVASINFVMTQKNRNA